MPEIDWKAVGRLGVSRLIAILLIYFLITTISTELNDQNKKIDDHAKITATKLEHIENINEATLKSIRLLNSISYQICNNQARTDYQRTACFEAADK